MVASSTATWLALVPLISISVSSPNVVVNVQLNNGCTNHFVGDMAAWLWCSCSAVEIQQFNGAR